MPSRDKKPKGLKESLGGLFGAARAVPNLFEQCRVATKSRKNLEQNFAEIAQLVEHDLAKVGVASSSLVFRSISQRENTRSFCYFQNNKSLVKVPKRTFWSSESRIKASFDSAESRQKAAIFGTKIAEIAQLVEHDLAKVGVASSSLVFRSDISA